MKTYNIEQKGWSFGIKNTLFWYKSVNIIQSTNTDR